jgi:hypothetical protein
LFGADRRPGPAADARVCSYFASIEWAIHHRHVSRHRRSLLLFCDYLRGNAQLAVANGPRDLTRYAAGSVPFIAPSFA